MNINFLSLDKHIPHCPTFEQVEELYNTFVIPLDMKSHEDFICSLVRYKHKKNIASYKITSLWDKLTNKSFVVYKLIHKGELVYAGSSISVETRLTKHLEDKRFDSVTVCTTSCKETMLSLEHRLIVDNKPKYNKDCNLRLANSYSGTIKEEVFMPLEEYQYSKKITKAYGTKISKLFSKGVPKFKREYLDGLWFIIDDTENKDFKLGYPRDIGKDLDNPTVYKNQPRVSWEGLLEAEGMLKYLVRGRPTKHMQMFYKTFILAKNNYRYKGSNKWYSVKDWNALAVRMIAHVKADQAKLKGKIDEACVPTLSFGKYKGLSVSTVKEKDPQYLEWCKKNLSPEVVKKLGI